MRIGRFTGGDPAAALREVKRALGPEAVILATRARPDGGVEITAAVDVDRVTDAVLPTPAATAAPSEDAAAILREVRALGARVAGIDRRLGGAPFDARTLGLVDRGFSEGMAERLVDASAAAVAAGLSEEAAVAAALRDLVGGSAAATRVTAFVGPTGCGKTTTIAKLVAARVAAGAGRIGLVMADASRIGAAEQLGAYARLLGVPMRTATDADELARAVDAFADRDAIYVDTAGLGGDDADGRALQRLLAGQGSMLAVTLVVSAAASAAALRRTGARLQGLAPAAAVVTKVDEGAGLGAACSWLAETGVRLAWLGTGQRVPDDLTPASEDALARWLSAA